MGRDGSRNLKRSSRHYAHVHRKTTARIPLNFFKNLRSKLEGRLHSMQSVPLKGVWAVFSWEIDCIW